ncbi:MAG TPA: alpha/beta hydrolase [Candidatus Kapabacteria bacterium]|jgi:para-nitrobenzyl esterase|nr:alpha/beta hydrolase [Ignavibacteria bacterium]HRE57489.1 alpha/beta hydrolase [Candidatus Kapabacteria bacterium]HRK60794.1 alpha/beta hydrolase [Candidatus Kapabacteria bacterium]
MKIYKKQSIAFLLAIVCTFGCNNTDETQVTSTPNITFSSSPFDLQGINAKFAKDIIYDTKERTQFDIWLPNSNTPTGLVIYVHGGGFTSGDKDFVYSVQSGGAWDFPSDIRFLLKNNIAVATVRYTLLNPTGEKEGIKKPMSDVRRALQYIRYRASDFNINKDNIIVAGNSAGAGTSLWIALHNDFADSENSDPVLRQSTRVKGVVARETQSSYDIEGRWAKDVFPDYNLTWSQILANETGNIQKLYGVSSLAQYESPAIDAYRNEVDMLSLLSSDDPELWINNTLRDVVNPYNPFIADIPSHHAFHARALKQRADAVGVKNISYYGKNPLLYSDPGNETWTEFCKRKINE